LQKREALIAEARRWVRTPHRHQHEIMGHGADCWTTVKASGVACGVLPFSDERFAPFAAYSEQPSPRTVLGVLREFFLPVEGDPLLADVACIAWRPGLPMHLAILGDWKGRPTLIHCLKREVVEHGFSYEWPGRVHSWWRYPGLAD